MHHGTKLAALSIAVALACSGCGLHVDGDTYIKAGAHAHSQHSVGGDIVVGDKATAGALSVVGGIITVGSGATIQSARVVSGEVHLHEGVQVTGNVQTVDGTINAEAQTHVGGDVATLVGAITLDSVDVAGKLQTTSGTIRVTGASVIRGGIDLSPVKPDEKNGDMLRSPRVILGPQVRVIGPITAARGGTLTADTSTALGQVSGIRVVREAGVAER